MACLSKKLDCVAAGWPRCLRVIAEAALLVKDADKLTLGQNITLMTPHTLESVIRQPPDRWTLLNPATLLPDVDEAPVERSCQEILAEETGL